ncbi:MAG: hypothetical protein A2350_17875 [Candidatus Raymondbacteria bacterium RifOxyB12_full_50_8]|nr:MAG: hypothetical protein A2350_17875 [Candidatus Raymondbacteria bacterium RifOxyB12_full_50_8]
MSQKITAQIERTGGKTEIQVLLDAFHHFEANARRLEDAYNKMQADFSRVNIELDRKNKLLSHILHSLTDAVVAVNTSGEITSFNRGAEILTGFKSEDVLGKNYSEILGKEIPGDQTLLHTLETGQHLPPSEKSIIHKEGHPVPVAYSTSLLEDNDGKALGALEVLSDLSEVKQMQEEIQRNKTLAAMGEMSAHVAHEIRNPLGAIAGFTAMLEHDLEKDPPKLDLVKKIINSISRLNKIVSNLLIYTRPLSLQSCEVDICTQINQVLDFISIGMVNAEKIVFSRAFPPHPVVLRIDPEKIEKVLINLVQNAAQAIPDQGAITVTVTAKQSEGREKLYLNGIRTDRIVVVEIADTGLGIKKEHIEKLFFPFFTTKATEGTGLGLSIVKKIMELHNGEIKVLSTEGQGSIFSLHFPG